MSAVQYRETIWSELFPGNRHTAQCLQPAVRAAESSLELAEAQRRRTVWRLDGGAGSDDHLRWLLARGYHVVAKGMSHRRAQALARQVQRWDPCGNGWLGEVAPPIDYGRPVRVLVKKRLKEGKFVHSYYVSSLSLSSKRLYLRYYNHRGAAEIEQFRNDKQGLAMAVRRKRKINGQLGYILLTDLAHNLLAHFHHHALRQSPFVNFGIKRILRDLLATPGNLIFEGDHLVRIELLTQMKNSQELLDCLERYCSGE